MNGQLFSEKFPLRSLFYGEGVFETFRWKGTRPVLWNNHMERMKRGAELLGIPFRRSEYVLADVEKSVLESKISDAYVKICLLSLGRSVFYETPQESSLLVVVKEYQTPKGLLKAHISSFRRNSTSPIVSIKSLNYLENIVARREAMGLGFDEAIFLNEEGEVTEAAASNIFWLEKDVLYTPSLECGVLSGVVRGMLMETARDLGIEVVVGKFGLSSLLSSQGVLLTNSLTGIASAAQIDEHKIDDGSLEVLRLKTSILEKLNWF